MTKHSDRSFNSDFRRFFLRGLVVLLPSVLTLWIAVKAYQFVYYNIAEPINAGVRLAIVKIAPYTSTFDPFFAPNEAEIDQELARRVARGEAITEQQVRDQLIQLARTDSAVRSRRFAAWWSEHWSLDLIGLIVAILAVYFAGRLLGGFLGRRVYRGLERFLTSVPVFKQIYPYVKQIVDFLFSDEHAIKFNRVVVIQYPRMGIWSVGFMTGGTLSSVAELAGDAITIFIPSSPTPFTGYTITVPRSDVIELPITVEEALRFVVSGGVLVPDHQVVRTTLPDGTVVADGEGPPIPLRQAGDHAEPARSGNADPADRQQVGGRASDR